MPFKLNAAHRDKFPRARYRVTNWPEYDRTLVQRGDIRFWIAEDILEDWAAPRRQTPGGQRRYSNRAIKATLMLGAVFRLPLRQTEGFVRGLIALMDAAVIVPDHTTLARRSRTVTIDMAVSANSRPTDIALDSTGLKFFGAPFHRLLRNRLPDKGGMGASEARRKSAILACAAYLGRPGTV